MFTVKQDISVHAIEATLANAIQIAQDWIQTVSNPTTFTVEDEDGAVVASETNRRIIGTFTKQMWIRDFASHVEDEEFDATDAILAMPLETIRSLVKSDTSTDDIGSDHVDWDGPFEVQIIEPICEFFGVEELADITQENLDYVRSRHLAAVRVQKTVTLTVLLSLDTTEKADLADFVSSLHYDVKSKTAGTKVTATEIRDFEVA